MIVILIVHTVNDILMDATCTWFFCIPQQPVAP